MSINLELDTSIEIELGVDMTVTRVDATPYTGQTVVIPTGTRQILPTTGTLLTQDITIEPIPHNYGLIRRKGSILTIS